LESILEIPGKFWNVLLEKDGEDQLYRSCEEREVFQRVKKERNMLNTVKWRKAIWIGQILRTNCLLEHVIEGKIEGKVEVTGRRRRRLKYLPEDLTETRGYWKLKERGRTRSHWV
jgi:hypothetical protein